MNVGLTTEALFTDYILYAKCNKTVRLESGFHVSVVYRNSRITHLCSFIYAGCLNII